MAARRSAIDDIDVAKRAEGVVGECGTVLLPRPLTVPGHGRKMMEHREPRRPLDQRADRGAVRADDEIAFSMARPHDPGWPIGGFGKVFADHDLRRDEGLAAAFAAGGEARSVRPVRRQAVSSRRNAPRPWM